MADITAVVAALNQGKSARRKRWSAYSSIYLNEQKKIMRRLPQPALATHAPLPPLAPSAIREVAVEIDWHDLTASDWILLEPMPDRARHSTYVN